MAIQIISGGVYSDMRAEAEAIPGVKNITWHMDHIVVLTGADIPVAPVDPVTPIELTLPN